MGRFLKNTRIPSAGSGAILPAGGTALRPPTAIRGDIRFNTDTNLVEVYYNSTWNSLTKIGAVNITKDTFTGDSSQTIFTMSNNPAPYAATPTDDNKVIVVVGNVFQNPSVAYTPLGNQITFTSAPPFGQTVIVLHGFASTNPA